MKHALYGAWNGWSVYWLLWLGAGFLVPEMWVLVRGQPQNTLSDQVWHLTGQSAYGQHLATWTFGHFLILAFCIWITGHFVLGWWR